MTHLISLSTRETVNLEGGGTSTKVTKVIEGRTTHMIIHVLLLVSVALRARAQARPQDGPLRRLPLYGRRLDGGQPALRPHRAPLHLEGEVVPAVPHVKNVSKKGIHTFTIFQLLCFGLVYGMMRIDAISVGFPFMIGVLIFVRMGMHKMWSKEQLAYSLTSKEEYTFLNWT